MKKRKSDNSSFDHGEIRKKKGKLDKSVTNNTDKIPKGKDKKFKKGQLKQEIRKPTTLQSMLNEKLEKAKANRLNRGKSYYTDTNKAMDIILDEGITDFKEHRNKEVHQDKNLRENDLSQNLEPSGSNLALAKEIATSKTSMKEKKHKMNAGNNVEESFHDENLEEAGRKVTSTEKKANRKKKKKESETLETAVTELSSKKKALDETEKKKKENSVEGNSVMHSEEDEVQEGHEDYDPEMDAVKRQKREKRKLKKIEKERKKKENQEKAGTAKVAAVEYLKQWKNKRDEWKFQKVRQVWLLQNMYDQSLLDDESFEVLLEYLEGLKGKSRETTVSAAEAMLGKEETADAEAKLERARQIIQLLSDG